MPPSWLGVGGFRQDGGLRNAAAEVARADERIEAGATLRVADTVVARGRGEFARSRTKLRAILSYAEGLS